MKNLAIFASGSGSNAENIVRYFSDSKSINPSVILSNSATAGVHQRAELLNIPSFTFLKKNFDEGALILEKLNEFDIDWIILAGFLLKVPPALLNAYPNRIINIHPALLPKYGGKGMYGMHVHQAVVDAKEKESGITIHYVNENYDEGAIIYQATCPVLSTDKAEDVANKIHQLEYQHFPKVIEDTVLGHFSL